MQHPIPTLQPAGAKPAQPYQVGRPDDANWEGGSCRKPYLNLWQREAVKPAGIRTPVLPTIRTR